MCNDFDCIDVWRIHNRDLRRYTWMQTHSLKQSRLDFFLISSELNTKFVSCDIKPGYRTDHSLIDITLDFSKVEHGYGYWKFNNSLLKDPQYSALVKDTSEVLGKYAASPYLQSNLSNIRPKDIQLTINDQVFFEMLLMKIRGKTISYSAWKKKESNKIESTLQKEIDFLSDKISRGVSTSIDLLNAKQAELVDLRKSKMEGIIIRSKARWLECGEKPCKFFLNMEKRNFVNKSITGIVNEANSILTSSKDILTEARSFYKSLYSFRNVQDGVELNSIFAKASKPILSDSIRDSIEGPLSFDELLLALKKSKSGKSPGSDGFSFEFYKHFSSELAWYLLRSLNYAYFSGKLSVTQKYGIITLLPKGDKPRQYLKNWRPISLLNTSYKIASACIAERLKGCLPRIIHERQKGFMAGRFT